MVYSYYSPQGHVVFTRRTSRSSSTSPMVTDVPIFRCSGPHRAHPGDAWLAAASNPVTDGANHIAGLRQSWWTMEQAAAD